MDIANLTKEEALAIIASLTVQNDSAPTDSSEPVRVTEPASAAEISLVREYLELLRQETLIKQNKEAIKSLMSESMVKRHLKALTYSGLPLVTITPTTSTTRDWAGLEEDHPDIAKKYTTSTPTTRMDFKKNVLPADIVSDS